MAGTYTNLLFHIVFSTKERRRLKPRRSVIPSRVRKPMKSLSKKAQAPNRVTLCRSFNAVMMSSEPKSQFQLLFDRTSLADYSTTATTIPFPRRHTSTA